MAITTVCTASGRVLAPYKLSIFTGNAQRWNSNLRDKIKNGPDLDHFVKQLQPESSSCETHHHDEPADNGRVHTTTRQPLPPWLKRTIPTGENYTRLSKSLRGLKLNTVCEEAKCPNIGECWGGGEETAVQEEDRVATATIMLMGDTCTRGCRFCAVKTSRTPPPLDPAEPENVSTAVASWGVDYIVITTVDRDDLPDSGAAHFVSTVKLIKSKKPSMLVECLTGDFAGNLNGVEQMALSGLDVYAHNVETVESLQRWVRDRRAGYKQSLKVLEHAKKTKPDLVTKSSLMLGVGETDEEVRKTLQDLLDVGVECVTIGQYLQPTKKHMKVHAYVPPEKFQYWKEEGERMGLKYVASGPLVRSSYRAGELFMKTFLKNKRQHAT